MASAPKITIDRNVPFPRENRGRNEVYPFSQMKVGDSFVHPGSRKAAAAAAFQFNRRNRSAFKFSYREEASGTRVWRRA